MAHASKNHMGKSAGGKKSGSGAMTPESSVDDVLGENQVLSNRDKAVAHNQERGLDSQHVQNEQRQDNASNRQVPADPLATSGGIPAPSSTGSPWPGSSRVAPSAISRSSERR